MAADCRPRPPPASSSRSSALPARAREAGSDSPCATPPWSASAARSPRGGARAAPGPPSSSSSPPGRKGASARAALVARPQKPFFSVRRAPLLPCLPMALRSILIADDEEPIRHVLAVLLSEQGYFVRAAKDGEEALRELAARDYDALVTDVRMPGMDGLSLVRAVQQHAPETTVIVMSAYGSHDLALEAMKAGAYDYLGKPFRPDEVLLVLRKAEERERLRAENRRLRREIQASRGAHAIVAESPAMTEVLRLAQQVAPGKTTVLIP